MWRDLYFNEYLFYLSHARLIHLIAVISPQLSQLLHLVLMESTGIFILLSVEGFDQIVSRDQCDVALSALPAVVGHCANAFKLGA